MVAHLVLVSASVVDGGCQPCVQGAIDEAMFRAPELPWEDAAEMLRPESRRYHVRRAVRSSREHLKNGGEPRHMLETEDEFVV
jgi:hypothetical protein